MFRLSCSSQTLTKHRFLAYPRESIPILRQIFQAGECRKVKYSVLFLVGFYDPVFLDIGRIDVKVEGVVPEISFFNREGRKLYFSRYNGGKGRVNFYPYFTHFRAWPLPSCELFIAQSLRCHLKFEVANESARWTLLAQNRCELALESVTGRYDCSTVNRSQAWRSKGIFKNHYILKVSSKIRTIHWVSISMGILRKSKKIKQVIVPWGILLFYRPRQRWLCPPFWKVTEVRRDVILARELNHQIAWRRPLLPDIKDLKIRGLGRRENVAEKVNSRSFNLHRDYSKSLTLTNVGEPS